MSFPYPLSHFLTAILASISGLAYFGLAYFGLAYFDLAYFDLAYFDLRHPNRYQTVHFAT